MLKQMFKRDTIYQRLIAYQKISCQQAWNFHEQARAFLFCLQRW